MTVTLIKGDAGALPLADASIDLVVTSPPYWALRSYTDAGEHIAGQIGAEPTPAAYVDSLIRCTAEWTRVLRPGGSMWVNLGDKYAERGGPERAGGVDGDAVNHRAARPRRRGRLETGIRPKSLMGLPWRYAIRCVDQLELILRAEVIWEKPNALPESVTDRVRRSHETWFHLVKSPRYYASTDAVRVPHRKKWVPGRNGGRARSGLGHTMAGLASAAANVAGSLPGSVRRVSTQPLRLPAALGVDHHAAFPMDWPRWIVTGWCPPEGVVLDPFGGTGTTALVASALGRRALSVEMSADYCRIAAWRTSDPAQMAKAAGRPAPKRGRVRKGQLELFVPRGGS